MINIQQNKKILILLFVILAVAGFFRVWQLDSIPPGVYPDEAINANQAIEEPGKIFYPENNGREGFYINLIAMSFSVFGISIFSFKIVSAIIGILTVLGLYLLVLELFPQHYENRSRSIEKKYNCAKSSLAQLKYQFIALASCFFLATSFWHINFSRIGFRAILVPLILIFSFYFLFRGFREKKIYNFLFAGLIFGLGFHTYIAFRVAVLLIFAVLFFYWIISMKQKNQKQFFVFASCFLLFTFIAALPIGMYFLENPADFMGRAGGVSVFAASNPIKTLGISFITHMASFNFFGDYNWRHNISGSPILFWPVGILFLIGFVSCAKDTLRHLIQTIQKKISFKFETSSFMILWFFIMLLPGFLSSEGIPHSLRCIGAIPPVFIFAGIGAEFLYSRLRMFLEVRPRKFAEVAPPKTFSKLFIIFAGMLLMISFTYAQYHRYFIFWGQNPATQNAFSCNCVTIGNYLNTLPYSAEKYVIIDEPGPHIPLPVETIKFIQHTQDNTEYTNYIFPEQIKDIEITDKQAYIVLMDKNQKILSEIQTHFPEGEIIKTNEIWGYNPQ